MGRFEGEITLTIRNLLDAPLEKLKYHWTFQTHIQKLPNSFLFYFPDDDIFFPPQSPYHPPSRQYSSSSEPMMSGLTFQLQSGIHKKSVAVEANEIALRDLRHEAFQFVKEIVSFLIPELFQTNENQNYYSTRKRNVDH